MNNKCIHIFNLGKRGQYVWTDGQDEAALSRGVYNTYTQKNLRYSQVSAQNVPISSHR